jgi:hypothetical protein
MVLTHRDSWAVASVVGATLVMCALVRVARQDSPEIHIANEQIDIGTIDGVYRDPNRPERIEFEITNRGSGVLKLTRIHIGCPCAPNPTGAACLRNCP